MTDGAMPRPASRHGEPERARRLVVLVEFRAVVALLDPVVAAPQHEHQPADDRDQPECRARIPDQSATRQAKDAPTAATPIAM